MRNIMVGVLIYTLTQAFIQILIKWGVAQIGDLKSKSLGTVIIKALLNPFILGSIALLAFSLVLWMYILSQSKLSIVFPLTALTYVFVALLAYFLLGEKLSAYGYFGIVLITSGIFFLLYK